MQYIAAACSIYTCRLEFAEEDDPKLKYTLTQLTAEYDPTDRRSPKRKERDRDNGTDTLITSVCSFTDVSLCCSSGLDARSHGSRIGCLDNLIRVPALGEPLFAQLGTVNEYHLRLKLTFLVDKTAIKGEHLFAEAASKGKHLFAGNIIGVENLFAGTRVGW